MKYKITLFFISLCFSHAVFSQVTLNLKNADIRTLIETISELTGKNFIIDPRIKGKISIISQKPLAKDELYQVFLSVLRVHGYAAIKVHGSDIIKIVPNAQAKQDDNPFVIGGEQRGDSLITTVIPLVHVSAAQLVPILRPLIPQQSHLAAYPGSNILVITDRAGNVNRLHKIIKRIDIKPSANIELISLEHASATEVKKILDALFINKSNKRQKDKFVADSRTNSIIVSSSVTKILKIRALTAHLDTPLDAGGNTQVIYLNYASAEDLVPVLKGIMDTVKEKGSKKKTTLQRISIQAEPRVNALVITAPHAILRSLKQVINKLDIRRSQILIKAIIADVSVDQVADLGIQWVIDGRQKNNPVSIINFTGSNKGISNLLGEIPTVPDGLSLGVGDFDNDTLNFGALISALAGNSQNHILSTPSLMTLDNEEAEILVGQEVPFVTGQFTTDSNSSVNPFQTIEREDIGIKLKITPQINQGNTIKLKISQEVSSIRQSSGRAADIVTDKRTITTSVLVENKQLLILGGLMDETSQESTQKVPFLGDIPYLGVLFRAKTSQLVRRNLMVFIYPEILNGKHAETYSKQSYTHLRNIQLSQKQQNIQLMPKSMRPVLPDLKQLLRQK